MPSRFPAHRPHVETPEEAADRMQREANYRAYLLQLENQHYDRWLRESTQTARQPYLESGRRGDGRVQ
jgi:hypothetical protein